MEYWWNSRRLTTYLSKRSTCTFRQAFKIFQSAAKSAAAARSKVVRAVPRGAYLCPRSPLWKKVTFTFRKRILLKCVRISKLDACLQKTKRVHIITFQILDGVFFFVPSHVEESSDRRRFIWNNSILHFVLVTALNESKNTLRKILPLRREGTCCGNKHKVRQKSNPKP